MEKRAVEHHPRRGLETEADVAQTDHRVAIRKLARNSPRSLDRLQRIPPILFNPRADRQHQRIKKNIPILEAIYYRKIANSPGDRNLPLPRPGHRIELVFINSSR